jgi:hypothetical protein
MGKTVRTLSQNDLKIQKDSNQIAFLVSKSIYFIAIDF